MRSKDYKPSERVPVATDLANFRTVTQSDNTGPVTYGFFSQTNEEGIRKKYKYKVAKPYRSAVTNDDNIDNDFISSRLDYQLLDHICTNSSLSGDFSSDRAMSNAILNTLETSNLLLGVTALEFKQTQSMLTNVFVRLYNLIFDLYKSAKKVNIREIYELCSNAWLEIRYGWRPLYGELSSLYKLIQKQGENTKGKILSKHGLHDHELSESVWYDLPEDFIVLLKGRNEPWYEPDTEAVFRGKIEILNVLDKSGFNYLHTIGSRNESLLAQLGLDLESLPLTIWELVPFSFVLDMFIKAGDLLAVDTFAADVSPFNGYDTKIYDYRIKGHITSVATPKPWSFLKPYFVDPKILQASQVFAMKAFSFKSNLRYSDSDGPNRNGFKRVTKQIYYFYREEDLRTSSYVIPAPWLEDYEKRFGVKSDVIGFDFPGSLKRKLHHDYHEFSVNFGLTSPGNGISYDYGATSHVVPFKQSLIDAFCVEANLDRPSEATLDSIALSYSEYLSREPRGGKAKDLVNYCERLFPNVTPFIKLSTYSSERNSAGRRIRKVVYSLSDKQLADIRLGVNQPYVFRSFYELPTTIEINTPYESVGRFTSRTLNDDITYQHLPKVDLSPSQMVDLAIFAERLTGALLKSRN